MSDATPPLFKSKKRPKKLRKRIACGEDGLEDSQADVANEEQREPTRDEILLLKQAQTLREKHRTATSDGGLLRRKRQDSQEEDIADGPLQNGDVLGGLTSNFSAEKAGQVREERMSKFIEEGLRKKFGGPEVDTRGETHASTEIDVYDISDRLQVEEGPLYDPSEGMPAAGLEEVTLPEVERRKKVNENIQAHKEFAAHQRQKKRAKQSDDHGGRNISADFTRHRSERFESYIASKAGEDDRKQSGIIGQDAGRSKVEAGDDRPDRGGNKGKRSAQASDAAFAERFRKRWRKT